jgi:hypothetical protein
LISGAYSIRKNPLYGLKPLAAGAFDNYFYTDKLMAMKTFYQIESKETGIVLLRRRKIAKALRRWLRENNIPFEYTFCLL